MSKTISFYMTKNPVSVNQELSMKNVLQIMDDEGLSHLLVQDEHESLVGVISKLDLFNRVQYLLEQTTGSTFSEFAVNSTTAEDLMTSDLVVVKPEDSLDYGVELLMQKEFHCLPVVQDKKAVGIITSYDLLKGYYQEFG